ncbi:MAG: hypothetical protein ACMUIG_06490 [Thermoplasmatota archaeon]
MELMRSKGKMTRLLILREIVLKSPKGLKGISEGIGITQQAVSDYLKKMGSEGLVRMNRGGPGATVDGVEYLQHNLLLLKEFVDGSISGLEIVRSTDAVADTDIRKGQMVTLYMSGGLLFARPGDDGPSTGRAECDAARQSMVSVSDLSGLVPIGDPVVVVVEILPARSGGGDETIGKEHMENLILSTPELDGVERGDLRVAALDLEAAALLRRSGIRYDLEMPGPRSIIDCTMRGLSVISFSTPYSASRLTAELETDRSGPKWVRGLI